ncbi:type II toxin-antitoxin system YoeB family toxin [Candidatus Odyssella thessalonicensis]|uniref:type II toxin-antitoxin system YoeB family toxin n=1 Tax=Candidatus Odyssella thessalonicensis TaxID=84647 RepID=UPI000225B6E5|nr:type II toxin-antitoxin system YoeB family toxin [Candidatus Odyssella thessalonicensis]
MKSLFCSLLRPCSLFLLSLTGLAMDSSPEHLQVQTCRQVTPFPAPELFQFPFLKGLSECSVSELDPKLEYLDGRAKPKTQAGIAAKIGGNLLQAQRDFLDASTLGSEIAMVQLGHMAVAREDYSQAFHWYNLAQYTAFLKRGIWSEGPAAIGGFEAVSHDDSLSNISYLNLMMAFQKYNFSNSPLSVPISVRAFFILTPFLTQKIFYPSPEINESFLKGLAHLAGQPPIWDKLGRFYEEKSLGDRLTDEERYQRAANCFWNAKTPEAWHELGNLINEHKIHYTDAGEPILGLQRVMLAADCYRRAGLRESFFKLAIRIHDKQIHQDENNQPFIEKDRNKVEARCLLKAALPIAYELLAEQIREKKVKCDTQGQFIDSQVPESFYYETAAYYLRKANTPFARLSLAELISVSKIDTDEKGRKITTARERRQAIVRICESLRLEDFSRPRERQLFLTNFGSYINGGILYYDALGKRLKSHAQRAEIAAQYYREAGSRLALANLAGLILHQLTDLDAQGNKINSEEERFQIAERYSSHYSFAHYNLALITLHKYHHLSDYRQRALNYAIQAIALGHESAIDLYLQIKKEIDKEGPLLEKEFNRVAPELEALPEQVNEVSAENLTLFEEPTVGTMEAEMTPEAHKEMKEIAKKLKNHRAQYKKLLRKQLSTNEVKDMVDNQLQTTPTQFNIAWSKNAVKQFRKLPYYEAKKVLHLIQLIREGEMHRGRPEMLKGEDKIITRRIDKGDRLAYSLIEDGIHILSTKEHFKK